MGTLGVEQPLDNHSSGDNLENRSPGPPMHIKGNTGYAKRDPYFDAESAESDVQRGQCPCCHTHSQLVLERTLHDGFTSTVVCCSRHGIDPSSPQAWSPRVPCACSPLSIPQMHHDNESALLETSMTLSELRCDGISLEPPSRGRSLSVHSQESFKSAESSKKYLEAPNPPDTVAATTYTKPHRPGVDYMRLPSSEARVKEREQQRRASSNEGSISKDPWRSYQGKDVVVKIIHKDLMEDQAMEKAIYEVELLRELANGPRHPHVMPLLSSVDTPKELWLFFEHAELDDLYKFTKYQTVSENDARTVCRQLLPALAYIHSKGIVHCDIKPQNILISFKDDVGEDVVSKLRDTKAAAPVSSIPLSPAELLNQKKVALAEETRVVSAGADDSSKGQCLCSSSVWHKSCSVCQNRCRPFIEKPEDKARQFSFRPTLKDVSMQHLKLRICDFGMAQRLNANGIIVWEKVRGTHGYMAPEILLSQDYNEKIDVWAFGCTICRLLTGQEPFYPASACRNEDFRDKPCLWQGRSEECKDFVKLLLSRDWRNRPSAAEAVKHPWLATGDC